MKKYIRFNKGTFIFYNIMTFIVLGFLIYSFFLRISLWFILLIFYIQVINYILYGVIIYLTKPQQYLLILTMTSYYIKRKILKMNNGNQIFNVTQCTVCPL
jgi:hypothetical protein